MVLKTLWVNKEYLHYRLTYQVVSSVTTASDYPPVLERKYTRFHTMQSMVRIVVKPPNCDQVSFIPTPWQDGPPARGQASFYMDTR